MKRFLFLLAVISVLTLVLGTTGCRKTAPIFNVEQAPVETNSGSTLTLGEVADSIKDAGMGLGWRMNQVAPNHIIATLDIRSHRAIVDITFSPKNYDITYKSSVNLKHKPDGRIHPYYNGWIQNLDRDIQTQLRQRSYKK